MIAEQLETAFDVMYVWDLTSVQRLNTKESSISTETLKTFCFMFFLCYVLKGYDKWLQSHACEDLHNEHVNEHIWE